MSSGRVKGLNIEIGADTTKLQSALNQVDKSAVSLNRDLKDINNLLKYDPTNATLLAQKHDVLSQKVDNAKKRVDILREAEEKVKQQTANGDIGAEAYAGFQRELIESGSKLETYRSQLKETEDAQKGLGDSASSMGTKVSESSGKVSDTASKLSSVGTSLTVAGQTMNNNVTQPLINIGEESATAGASYETAINSIVQAAGDCGVSSDELKTKMEELAETTGTKYGNTASEAAGAMEELVKSGMTPAQVEGGALESTLKLAAAGGMSLADSSSAVTASMSMFHLSAQDADTAVTALAGGANASRADVSDLSKGLSQCGAVASSAGWSIQDTTSALAMFSNAGIDGSDAGTSLKTMLLSLEAPSSSAKQAMEQYGISLYNSDGSMKNSAEVAENLKTGLGGLDDATRNAALSQIFGSDATRVATVMMQNGKDGMQQYTDAVNDSSATQGMADVKTSGLQGSMSKAAAAFDLAKTKLGKALAPAIEKVAGFITDLMGKFSALSPQQQTIIAVIGAVVAAIGPVLLVMGQVMSAIAGFLVIGPVIGAAVAAINWPIVAAVAAIVAVSVAVGALIAFVSSHMDQVQGFFSNMGGAISTWAANAGSDISNWANNAVNSFTDWTNKAGDAVSNWASNTGSAISNWASSAADTISTWASNFSTGFETGMQLSGQIAQSGLSVIGDLFTGNLSGAVETVDSQLGLISNAFRGTLLGDAAGYARNALNNIYSDISEKMDSAKNAVSNALGAISGFFSGMRLEFPSIKLPHFNAHNFSANPLEWVSNPPYISVDWYATGGVANGASIVGVGEAGPEAILPLSGRVLESVAQAIAGAMGAVHSGDVYNIRIGDLTYNDDSQIAEATKTYIKRIVQLGNA